MEFFNEIEVRDRFIDIYEKLKILRIVNNAMEFCDKAKINYKSADHVFNKRRDFQFIWMPNIIKAYNVNPFWFMYGEGDMFLGENLQNVDQDLIKKIQDLEKLNKDLDEENRNVLRDFRKLSNTVGDLEDRVREYQRREAESDENKKSPDQRAL